MARWATLGRSGFGYYHGGNEALYSLLALGYDAHPLDPLVAQSGDRFYNTPPLTGYVLWVSFHFFGSSEVAARLPALLAELLAFAGVFFAARKLYGAAVARTSLLLFAALPWNVLWFGRAQTDPFLVSLLTLSVGAALHARDRAWTLPLAAVALGLAGAAKQPAVLLLGAYGGWLRWGPGSRPEARRWIRRFVPWLLLGGLPLVVWIIIQLRHAPGDFLSTYLSEAGHRSHPFENASRDLPIALGLGMTPPVLLLAAHGLRGPLRLRDNLLAWWLGLYAVFLTLRTPFGHEYYWLAVTPPVAILAAAGLHRLRGPGGPVAVRAARVVTASTVALLLAASIATLGLAGDWGDHGFRTTAHAVDHYAQEHPGQRVALFVPLPHHLIFAYYLPGLSFIDRNATLTGFTYEHGPPATDRLENASTTSDHVLVVLTQGAHLTPPFSDRTVVGGAEYRFLFEDQSSWLVLWR